MLPAAARLRRREDFTAVVRRGHRVGRAAVVIHRLPNSPNTASPAVPPAGDQIDPQVGFIVGRGVGNAVRRHEVSRRLRHVMRDRLAVLQAGDRVVVRAKPAAAGLSSTALARDVDLALARLGLTSVAPSVPAASPKQSPVAR